MGGRRWSCGRRREEGQRSSARRPARSGSEAHPQLQTSLWRERKSVNSSAPRASLIKQHSLVKVSPQARRTSPLMIRSLAIVHSTIELPPARPIARMHPQRILLDLPLGQRDPLLATLGLERFLITQRATHPRALMPPTGAHRLAHPPAEQLVQRRTIRLTIAAQSTSRARATAADDRDGRGARSTVACVTGASARVTAREEAWAREGASWDGGEAGRTRGREEVGEGCLGAGAGRD